MGTVVPVDTTVGLVVVSAIAGEIRREVGETPAAVTLERGGEDFYRGCSRQRSRRGGLAVVRGLAER